MKGIRALAALGIGCATVGASVASGGGGHGLKPRALAFMRSVTIPDSGAPRSVRDVFASRRHAGKPRKALELGAGRGRMVLWVSPFGGHGWCERLQLPRTRFGGVNCAWVTAASPPFGGGYVGPEPFEGRA